MGLQRPEVLVEFVGVGAFDERYDFACHGVGREGDDVMFPCCEGEVACGGGDVRDVATASGFCCDGVADGACGEEGFRFAACRVAEVN